MAKPALATASRPDDSQSPLAALPFRAVRHTFLGRTCVILEYSGELLGPDNRVRVIPYRIDVGDPTSPEGVSNHLGKAIFDLIAAYRTLESTVTPLLTERDQLRERIATLERAVQSQGATIREQARRLEEDSGNGRKPRRES